MAKKAFVGLGYRLTLKRSTDNAVLNKDNAVNNAKIKINSIAWYVLHYRSSIQQQAIFFEQSTSKTPTELQNVEKSVFVKEVNQQNSWSFELGTQEGINIPIWINVCFQQRDRQHSQILNNETFYRPPVLSCQCIIGTERCPDDSIILIYADDDYSEGYEQIKKAFRALSKVDMLQPYISDNDFRSSNDGN